MQSVVSYGRSGEVWDSFRVRIQSLIDGRGLRDVCDVGGGAHPALECDYVASRGISYTVLDVSREELQRAPGACEKLNLDICSDGFAAPKAFDMVFSRMLAEHVPDGRRMHINIFGMLKPGGLAVHFFPTLYALPFVANRLLGTGLADRALQLVAPRDRAVHGKFPARYSWCRGPTRGMMRRFERLGYEIVEYRGLFGHAGYYERLPALKRLHGAAVEFLLRHPHPSLTSYALVVLRRPGVEAQA